MWVTRTEGCLRLGGKSGLSRMEGEQGVGGRGRGEGEAGMAAVSSACILVGWWAVRAGVCGAFFGVAGEVFYASLGVLGKGGGGRWRGTGRGRPTRIDATTYIISKNDPLNSTFFYRTGQRAMLGGNSPESAD